MTRASWLQPLFRTFSSRSFTFRVDRRRRQQTRPSAAPRVENLETRIVPTIPVVLAIARATPAGQYTSATTVDYTVTFNESVLHVAAADFHLTLDDALKTATPVVLKGSG